MDQDQIKAHALEGAKRIKTEEELTTFMQNIFKMVLETALAAELTEHLDYDKYQQRRLLSNGFNGGASKGAKSLLGNGESSMSIEQEDCLEPQLCKKQQARISLLDDHILSLYAKGMTKREITQTFQKLYGAEVSPTLVSKVTDAVMPTAIEWQGRPLDTIYPIVYLDCIAVKVRQESRVINKSVFLALGITLNGHKDVLGMWIAENESVNFWAGVLTELKKRGLNDILIVCVDGLTCVPEAINSIFPNTQVQRYIVHTIRTSLKYVALKDYKIITADLKTIYQATTEEDALLALDDFAKKWDEYYPPISRLWRAHWAQLNPFFAYPADIRKVVYTTNAIEPLNNVIRHAAKKRKVFDTDDSVRKVLFLAVDSALKKWAMPIAHWRQAMIHIVIMFEDRIQPYI